MRDSAGAFPKVPYPDLGMFSTASLKSLKGTARMISFEDHLPAFLSNVAIRLISGLFLARTFVIVEHMLLARVIHEGFSTIKRDQSQHSVGLSWVDKKKNDIGVCPELFKRTHRDIISSLLWLWLSANRGQCRIY